MIDAAIDESRDALDLVLSESEFRGYFGTTQKIQCLSAAELETAISMAIVLLVF